MLRHRPWAARRLPCSGWQRFLAKQGVATQVAATLLATTGDNSGRVRKEASFAALCGASPVDASSGKQLRHRLNRDGDRQANSALWTIAMTRLAHDPRSITTNEFRLQNVIEPGKGATRSGCLPIPCGRSG